MLGGAFAARQMPQKHAKRYASLTIENERSKIAPGDRQTAVLLDANIGRRYFGGEPFSVQS